MYQLDPTYDSRNAIVGDQYENYKENQYGNNDVTGPDAFHGTHVSGIIAAVRAMVREWMVLQIILSRSSLRVVPDGDERDKDIANAIRYAVDNGARVINMSFGKGESPIKRRLMMRSYMQRNTMYSWFTLPEMRIVITIRKIIFLKKSRPEMLVLFQRSKRIGWM